MANDQLTLRSFTSNNFEFRTIKILPCGSSSALLSARFSYSQSTICTHMMMLTIHTFMAIITADNYMDENILSLQSYLVSFFFSLSSVSSACFFFSFSYVNTHFKLCKRRLEKGEISNRYNWRQNTEFIYDKPKLFRENSTVFDQMLLRDISDLESTDGSLIGY